MTAIGFFFILLQLGGFIGGALVGGRAYDRLTAVNRGLPLIVAGIIFVAVGGYLVFTDGVMPNEWMRAIGFTAIAFAGAQAVRARNSVMGGR